MHDHHHGVHGHMNHGVHGHMNHGVHGHMNHGMHGGHMGPGIGHHGPGYGAGYGYGPQYDPNTPEGRAAAAASLTTRQQWIQNNRYVPYILVIAGAILVIPGIVLCILMALNPFGFPPVGPFALAIGFFCLMTGICCFCQMRQVSTYNQAYQANLQQEQQQVQTSGGTVPSQNQQTPVQPSGQSYPSGNAPYPGGNAPYPSGNAPYPSGNAPYPSGNAPYTIGNSPYPGAETGYQQAAPGYAPGGPGQLPQSHPDNAYTNQNPPSYDSVAKH